VEGGSGNGAKPEEQHNGQQSGYFKFKKNINFFKILNQIKGNSVDDFDCF